MPHLVTGQSAPRLPGLEEETSRMPPEHSSCAAGGKAVVA